MTDERRNNEPPGGDSRSGNEPPATNVYNRRLVRGWGWGWLWFLILMLILLFTGFNWGQLGWRGTAVAPNSSHSQWGQSIGKNVTATGKVDELMGPHVFILSGFDPSSSDTVLVVSKEALNERPMPVSAGKENVQVKGQLKRFDASELEKELGITLSSADFGQYNAQPVIVAETITFMVPAEKKDDGAR